MLQIVDEELITHSYTYHEYSQLIEEEFKLGRTTNNDNRDNMFGHTKLNIYRSLRWAKGRLIQKEFMEPMEKCEEEFKM